MSKFGEPYMVRKTTRRPANSGRAYIGRLKYIHLWSAFVTEQFSSFWVVNVQYHNTAPFVWLYMRAMGTVSLLEGD